MQTIDPIAELSLVLAALPAHVVRRHRALLDHALMLCASRRGGDVTLRRVVHLARHLVRTLRPVAPVRYQRQRARAPRRARRAGALRRAVVNDSGGDEPPPAHCPRRPVTIGGAR